MLWPAALSGRIAPEGGIIDLPMPLGPGTYLVAHGGTTLTVNLHLKTLDESVPRFTAYRGESYAVDLLFAMTGCLAMTGRRKRPESCPRPRKSVGHEDRHRRVLQHPARCAAKDEFAQA